MSLDRLEGVRTLEDMKNDIMVPAIVGMSRIQLAHMMGDVSADEAYEICRAILDSNPLVQTGILAIVKKEE